MHGSDSARQGGPGSRRRPAIHHLSDPEEAFPFMHHLSRIGPTAGILLLAGLAGLALVVRPGEAVASPSPAAPQAPAAPTIAAPTVAAPYYYGGGAQGFGYHVTPQPAARGPAQSAVRSRPATVGPGARNWATGNRVPLHRPWLRSRS
jgi:hypothetical protein